MHAKYPDVDLRAEHDKFTDYWRAQPGAKGRKAGAPGWNATWRNWIRRADESPRRSGPTNGQRRSTTEERIEATQAIEIDADGWLPGYKPTQKELDQ
jgi:hypothetical protein